MNRAARSEAASALAAYFLEFPGDENLISDAQAHELTSTRRSARGFSRRPPPTGEAVRPGLPLAPVLAVGPPLEGKAGEAGGKGSTLTPRQGIAQLEIAQVIPHAHQERAVGPFNYFALVYEAIRLSAQLPTLAMIVAVENVGASLPGRGVDNPRYCLRKPRQRGRVLPPRCEPGRGAQW